MTTGRSIGARELRHHLGDYLDRAYAGESFEITDRGLPVARLVPVAGRESPLDRLIADGHVRLPTRSLADLPPPRVVASSSISAEEALDEQRRDFWE